MVDRRAPVRACAADFVVRENGMAREILRVCPPPIRCGSRVLIDNSQEMRNELIDLRQGLRAFVNEMDRRHEVAHRSASAARRPCSSTTQAM